MTGRQVSGSHGANLGRARVRVGPSDAYLPSEHAGGVPEAERHRLEPFGNELRSLRMATGLSQQRLGELAGLRGDHIGRLERAQRRPTVGAIKALARILAEEAGREELERRLARLAGDSLREGAERRKQRAENRNRRLAVHSLQESHRKLRVAIRRQEAAGQIVSGSLRRVEQQTAELLERFKGQSQPDPEPISGYPAADERPRRGRLTKPEVLAWAKARTTEQHN